MTAVLQPPVHAFAQQVPPTKSGSVSRAGNFVPVKGLPVFTAEDKSEAPSLCVSEGASGFYRRG